MPQYVLKNSSSYSWIFQYYSVLFWRGGPQKGIAGLSVSVTPNLPTVHSIKQKTSLLIWGGCLSLSFFLHQQGEQIPQAKMLVLVAAIQTPCLCFTHTGTTAAVICPVSHSLLVATHTVGVHQISYQLSHGSGSFPNQLWMQQHCMWNWVRQPSYKISW